MRFVSVAAALLIVGAVSVAAACGDSDDGARAPDAPDGRTFVRAPIDELDLVVRESAPPRYAVRIVSGLPDGCAEFADVTLVGRVGGEIEIRVRNSRLADSNIVCTAIYGTHEETVDIGTDFVGGQEYVVRVNDKELRFTAQ